MTCLPFCIDAEISRFMQKQEGMSKRRKRDSEREGGDTEIEWNRER